MKSEGGRREGDFLRQEILAMVGEHERAEINFNEFVGILGRHSIKFYSPEEFKKMSKIFLASGNSLPLLEPFQYLDLHCKQMVGSASYVLLTRVLPRKLPLPVPLSQTEGHPAQRCLRDFVILMKRRYGNEINWFKVVGGMTVSVSIEAAPFRSNLQQILRNTPHRQCVARIVEMFAEKEGIVSWQRFMAVVKATVRAIASELKGHGSSKISLPPRANTEPSDNLLTVKSTFIRTAKPAVSKEHHLSQTLYETTRESVGTPGLHFQRQRYRSTTQTEDVSFNLDMKKCTIHERLKTAVNFAEQRSGNLTASDIRRRPYRIEMKERRREQTQSCWQSDDKQL